MIKQEICYAQRVSEKGKKKKKEGALNTQ